MDHFKIARWFADEPDKLQRYLGELSADMRNAATGPSLEGLAKELVRGLESRGVGPSSIIRLGPRMLQTDVTLIYDRGKTFPREGRLSHFAGREKVTEFFRTFLGFAENPHTTNPHTTVVQDSISLDLDFISVCVDRGRITCLYTRDMKMEEQFTRTNRLQLVRMIMDFESPNDTATLNVSCIHYHVLKEHNDVKGIAGRA